MLFPLCAACKMSAIFGKKLRNFYLLVARPDCSPLGFAVMNTLAFRQNENKRGKSTVKEIRRERKAALLNENQNNCWENIKEEMRSDEHSSAGQKSEFKNWLLFKS